MAQLKTPNDLGVLIRQRRKALAWDQATLAHAVGVSRRWVIEMEKGKPGAELGLILRTLNVLGLRLDATPSSSSPTAEGSGPRVDINRIIDKSKVEQAAPDVDKSALADLVGNWLARADSGHLQEKDSVEQRNVLGAPEPADGKHPRRSR